MIPFGLRSYASGISPRNVSSSSRLRSIFAPPSAGPSACHLSPRRQSPPIRPTWQERRGRPGEVLLLGQREEPCGARTHRLVDGATHPRNRLLALPILSHNPLGNRKIKIVNGNILV